jgi:hypothetical protein
MRWEIREDKIPGACGCVYKFFVNGGKIRERNFCAAAASTDALPYDFPSGQNSAKFFSPPVSAHDTFHLQSEELEIGKEHGPEAVVLY